MSDVGNGNYRLREIERRLSHLEEHGSRPVAIAQERITALNQRVSDIDRELRSDIEDTRKENAGTRATLGKVAWTLLTIPGSIVVGIVLFWVQSQ